MFDGETVEPPISGHEAGHAKAGRHAADLGADAGADQSAAGAFGSVFCSQEMVGVFRVTPPNKRDLHHQKMGFTET